MTSTDRLLTREMLHAKFYDVESMMEIKGSVANGYVVLLKGGAPSPKSSSKKQKPKKKKENDGLPLAFMSLTSGNVIDACFGVQNYSRRDDTPARRSTEEAKALLEECDTTDAFRQAAVSAYCEAFEAIIDHNDRMNKLNCITRCFRSKKIRRETEENVRTAFSSLVTAVGESR